MNVEVLPHGAFYSALVHLEPGDSFVSDSGAMFRASSNVDIDVTTKTKGGGGLQRIWWQPFSCCADSAH